METAGAARRPFSLSLPAALRAQPFALALPLALAGLLLAGCASPRIKGRFINLETGEETWVDATWSPEGSLLLQGDTTAGRPAARGEIWEMRTVKAREARARPGEAALVPAGDTLYHGTGFLRDGNRILDIQYHRPQGEATVVGAATDNRGARYKAVFWPARKSRSGDSSGR